MKDYTTTEFLKLKNIIAEMEVIDVDISEDVYTVRFKKKRTIADYISKHQPSLLIFKDDNDDRYEIKRKFVNMEGHEKAVYILLDFLGNIVDVYGLYELQHPESFNNEKLKLSVNEIIREER